MCFTCGQISNVSSITKAELIKSESLKKEPQDVIEIDGTKSESDLSGDSAVVSDIAWLPGDTRNLTYSPTFTESSSGLAFMQKGRQILSWKLETEQSLQRRCLEDYCSEEVEAGGYFFHIRIAKTKSICQTFRMPSEHLMFWVFCRSPKANLEWMVVADLNLKLYLEKANDETPRKSKRSCRNDDDGAPIDERYIFERKWHHPDLVGVGYSNFIRWSRIREHLSKPHCLVTAQAFITIVAKS